MLQAHVTNDWMFNLNDRYSINCMTILAFLQNETGLLYPELSYRGLQLAHLRH